MKKITIHCFLSVPALFWDLLYMTLLSCPSPAYHCRFAQYWLVGLQCCLVSVQVVCLCLCVLFLPLSVFVCVFWSGSTFVLWGRSLFGSGLVCCWGMKLAGSVKDKGSYTILFCITICITVQLQYNHKIEWLMFPLTLTSPHHVWLLLNSVWLVNVNKLKMDYLLTHVTHFVFFILCV